MTPGHASCVCEDHGKSDVKPLNTLVGISLSDGRVTTLAQHYDFYSSPTLSPEHRLLAWLCWNAPQMPWDGCELWLADLDQAGLPRNPRRIAGGTQESVFQPRFAPDGGLHFISDRDGFWNIYAFAQGKIEPITRDLTDYAFAQWNFGMSSYGFASDGTIVATRLREGCSELVRVTPHGKTERLAGGFTQIEHLHTHDERFALLASAPNQGPAIVLGGQSGFTVLSQTEKVLSSAWVSRPEPVRFSTTEGETAHAWYYPPLNADFSAPPDEKPPLLVKCHGGPTAMNGNGLDWRTQYWTSRGFAVADVNYRGSSGFGRAYRRSLYGQWGIKDAADCVHVTRHLVRAGRVDSQRTAITGNSAGGFTALCALASCDHFKAGSIYYGITDLSGTKTSIHKFEAHYGSALLGRWPAARDLYRRRSPLYAAARIHSPVIFFQGLRDRVVLPAQTERLVNSLRAKK